MQTLLTSRPACRTGIVCICCFGGTLLQLNLHGEDKMFPFITGTMYWEKLILLCIAFRWLRRTPRVGEHPAECGQSPSHIAESRSPIPGGRWMKESGSSSFLGNIQIGFCRYLGKTFAVSLQVTQKIRSKGFILECKDSVQTKNSRNTYPDTTSHRRSDSYTIGTIICTVLIQLLFVLYLCYDTFPWLLRLPQVEVSVFSQLCPGVFVCSTSEAKFKVNYTNLLLIVLMRL